MRAFVARLVVVVAMVGSLSGCWRQLGGAPGQAYYNGLEDRLTLDNVTELSQRWSTIVGGSSSEPMVLGGRVIVSGPDRPLSNTGMRAEVKALDSSSGSSAWTATVSASWPRVVVGTSVFVGDEIWVNYLGIRDGRECDGALVRLDSATGAQLGNAFAGAASVPVQFGEMVAFTGHTLDTSTCTPSSSTQLFVINEADRATVWSAPVSQVTTPVVIGDKIIVGDTAFAADGCGSASCPAVWTSSVGVVGRVAGSPEGHVFLGGDDGSGNSQHVLVAIDPADGHSIWTSAEHWFSGVGGIAVAGDFVYVVGGTSIDGDNLLRVYPKAGCGAPTCPELWSARLPGDAGAHPVVAGGVVYVPTRQVVAAYPAAGCAATTCETVATIPAGSFSSMPVTVAEGQIFVLRLDLSVPAAVLSAYAPPT